MLQRNLDNKTLYLLLCVALLMAAVYFVPVWQMNIGGKQFVEPLQLKVWVNRLTGRTDLDIDTINDFNQYVGVKEIHPSTMPELRLMPFILGFMILGAFMAILFRKVYMLLFGLINIAFVGLAGFFDYYIWLKDFGTDLDPMAPLFDGRVDYTPPLVGCKSIVEISLCSWPHIGTWVLVLCGVLIAGALVLEYKKK